MSGVEDEYSTGEEGRMSRRVEISAQERLEESIENLASTFFGTNLRTLKLEPGQIQEQTVPELEESLKTIDDAMRHPEQFGTLRIKLGAETGAVIAKNNSESHIEMGVLPILLKRKAMILDRIKLLRPVDQLAHLKSAILETIKDEEVRETVFRVLDAQEERQQKIASHLEKETKDVDEALEVERQSTAQVVALTKLEVRLEALSNTITTRENATEKAISKLEDKAVSKWDVVTIIFMSLAALGGLVGVVLGIVKWTSGG
jgi:hypothetical protein